MESRDKNLGGAIIFRILLISMCVCSMYPKCSVSKADVIFFPTPIQY